MMEELNIRKQSPEEKILEIKGEKEYTAWGGNKLFSHCYELNQQNYNGQGSSSAGGIRHTQIFDGETLRKEATWKNKTQMEEQ